MARALLQQSPKDTHDTCGNQPGAERRQPTRSATQTERIVLLRKRICFLIASIPRRDRTYLVQKIGASGSRRRTANHYERDYDRKPA